VSDLTTSLAGERHSEPGVLVVACGVDGAGKTSLLEGLADRLGADHTRRIVSTRQPTSEARALPLFARYLYEPSARAGISYGALTALMLSDRLQHMHELVLPELRGGSIVLCDRYIFTMVAAMLARGYDYPWIYPACEEFVRPDMCVLLDVSPNVAEERIRAREGGGAGHPEPPHLAAMIAAFRQLATLGCFDEVHSTTTLPREEILRRVHDRVEAIVLSRPRHVGL
jgi:dTMP kinase